MVEWDCVVVGAGIEGSSTAYQLALKGCKTLLIEQFPLGHSRGSSHGHSRITRYAYVQKHFSEMMPECFRIWAQLERDSNTKLYRREGLLVIDEPPYSNLNKVKGALDSINHKYTALTSSEICRKYPGVSVAPDTKGIIEHDGGILLADSCLRAMQTQFLKHGGTIRDSEKVLQVIPGDIVTIVTNKGRHQAKNVVLTPGPWASKLLRPLGLDPPLKVWRLDVCYWQEKIPGQFDNFPVFIAYGTGNHCYALPSEEYPGLVKVCDHTEHELIDPDARDAPSSDHQLREALIKKFIQKFFPGLHDTPAIVERCIYSFTPDESFYLDTHPNYPNIVIGCGFSGHGFKLSPVVGKVLSELVTGTKPSYDLSMFRLSRFPNGPLAKL
ncbi:peroxisomal sarcosine oxidase-like [Asterias rubens]|uniref:peroxisomal sarcosine oxidase-like n=1 Tax=Asterias rubens TaxID=7604 RepID=UPI0014552563|nr:peroxisomal sarcosine oxidase-like [Asterias rubens]